MKLNVGYDSILYKLISRAGERFIFMIESILTFFSKEKDAMLDPEKFEWTKNIEKNTEHILTELKAVMQDYGSIPSLADISEEQKRLVAGEQSWKTFMLYVYGARVEKNIARCPHTDQVIRSIPGMTMAFFSILEPHTRLNPHRGPYKGVLRYHLGLIIPEPKEQCGLKVDDKVYHWEAGKSLIFDDTFTHEVWNNSNEKRVVLFIDFKRDFVFPINLLNNFMIKLIQVSPFIANVLKKLEQG